VRKAFNTINIKLETVQSVSSIAEFLRDHYNRLSQGLPSDVEFPATRTFLTEYFQRFIVDDFMMKSIGRNRYDGGHAFCLYDIISEDTIVTSFIGACIEVHINVAEQKVTKFLYSTNFKPGVNTVQVTVPAKFFGEPFIRSRLAEQYDFIDQAIKGICLEQPIRIPWEGRDDPRGAM